MPWGVTKRFGRVSYRAGRVVVTLLVFFVGLAGIPDDLATWETWIDRAMSDPRVTQLAEYAVGIADFVNHPIVRSALVFAGILLLIWPLKRFWRFRHRLIFWGKRLVSDQVWISRSEALALIRNSRWAASREPDRLWLNVLRPVVKTGEVLQRERFLEMTLEKFEEYNEAHVRKVSDGKKEYGESALRRYLTTAFDQDVKKKFGAAPDIVVD